MGWFKKRIYPAHRLWDYCKCTACVDYKKQLLVELMIARSLLEILNRS